MSLLAVGLAVAWGFDALRWSSSGGGVELPGMLVVAEGVSPGWVEERVAEARLLPEAEPPSAVDWEAIWRPRAGWSLGRLIEERAEMARRIDELAAEGEFDRALELGEVLATLEPEPALLAYARSLGQDVELGAAPFLEERFRAEFDTWRGAGDDPTVGFEFFSFATGRELRVLLVAQTRVGLRLAFPAHLVAGRDRVQANAGRPAGLPSWWHVPLARVPEGATWTEQLADFSALTGVPVVARALRVPARVGPAGETAGEWLAAFEATAGGVVVAREDGVVFHPDDAAWLAGSEPEGPGWGTERAATLEAMLELIRAVPNPETVPERVRTVGLPVGLDLGPVVEVWPALMLLARAPELVAGEAVPRSRLPRALFDRCLAEGLARPGGALPGYLATLREGEAPGEPSAFLERFDRGDGTIEYRLLLGFDSERCVVWGFSLAAGG